MLLTPGTRLGPYDILGPLGAGGMGEVYRARDPRMGREVAIKVSAERFSDRFGREVHAVAALNHLNICHIYDVGPNYLVMELVEGPTLAERIKGGALPFEEAMAIARQIGDALEAAHEKGIIHRDLKLANIKIKPDGTVKVLDFGLAKMAEQGATAGSPESSPTVAMEATVVGQILGTAAYMSPEQARGEVVDKRTDIWAFGVVLWEMLTGQRMFEGETISDVLASVLKHEPNLDAVTEQVRPLLAACLQKDPRKRLRDIGDWRGFVVEPISQPKAQAQPRKARVPWIAAALAALGAIIATAAWYRASNPARPVLRFRHDLGPGIKVHDAFSGPTPYTGPNVVISSDGERIAFVASKPGEPIRLFTQRLDSTVVSAIPATDDAGTPFFSPDGRWIGFFAAGKLRRASVDGGAVQDICSGIDPMGATWSEDGNIIVAFGLGQGLSIVPASGGTPRPLVKLSPPEVTTHRWPQALPGGKAVLFSMGRGGLMDDGSVAIYSLESGTTKVVRAGAGFGRYLPGGRLLFLSKGTLFAAPFDLRRMEITGSAVPLFHDVKYAFDTGGAQLSASGTGTLLFRTQSPFSDLTLNLIAEGGTSSPLPFEPGPYRVPAVSPDGRRIALVRGESGNQQIWVSDLSGDKPVRISYESGEYSTPTWTRDGGRLLYSAGGDSIYIAPSDGSHRATFLLKVADGTPRVIGLTPDEKLLLYTTGRGVIGRCWFAPFQGGLRDSRVEAARPCGPATMGGTDLSPDGKWLAYTSVESGKSEVYVRSFPDNGSKWQISVNGGSRPAWSPAGGTLFWADTEGIMVVRYDVKDGVFYNRRPQRWSDFPIVQFGAVERQFGIMPDGKRVVVLAQGAAGVAEASQVNVIVNFFTLVDRALVEAKH
jgi:Tol biopolymer transport system component